jgi:hypothetical protein
MIFLCPQENAGMFSKSQVANTCFSRSPLHSDSEKTKALSMTATKFSFHIINFAINQGIKIPRLVSCIVQPTKRLHFRTTGVSGYIRFDFLKIQASLCALRWRSWCDVSLRVGQSADRIPVEARFSAPVQTGPGAQRASCTNNGSFLSGVKRPGRVVDHPLPSRAEVKERVEVELYLFSPSGPSWQDIG